MEHELKMAAAQNKRLKYEFKMKSRAADHNAQLELLRLQIQLAQVNATAAAAAATPAVFPANRVSTMDHAIPGSFTTPTASTSAVVPATPVPTYRPPLQSYNIHQTPILSSDDVSFGGSLDAFGSKTDTSAELWRTSGDFSDENTDYSSMIL